MRNNWDIVVTPKQWEKLRPTFKELQQKKKLDYEASEYYSGQTLIHCNGTPVAEELVDKKLDEILANP